MASRGGDDESSGEARMQTQPDTMPSAVLRDEHRVILRVIDVLERLAKRARDGRFEGEALARCVEFFRLFADACHHAKEEDLLFPVLEMRGIPRDGGPIGMMLYEHQLARQFTQEMGAAVEARRQGEADADTRFLDAAQKYIDLLRNHIYKENNVLFRMGDQAMSDEDQSELRDKFCEAGCRAFGGKQGDELRRMADELEAAWPA
jgi:hemerythrin-like domain-containing protein